MKMMGGGGGGGGGGQQEQAPQNAGQGIGQGITAAGDSLLASSQRELPRGDSGAVLQMLAQMGLLQGRAEGGPVQPGQSVTVGERGAEVVTAGANGGAQVTPLPKNVSSIVKSREGIKAFEQRMDAQTAGQLQGEYAMPDPRQEAREYKELETQAGQAPVPQQAGTQFASVPAVSRPAEADPITDTQTRENLNAVFPSRRAAPLKGESIGELVLDHLRAGLIGAISPEWLDQIRQSNRSAREKLAVAALQNPILLELSPTARGAFEAMTGANADDFLKDNDPSAHNKTVALAVGANLYVPGDKLPNGETAPPVERQLAMAIQARGLGFRLDDKGRFILDLPAQSKTERDTSASWARFDETRGQLEAADMPSTVANKLAARTTISELARIGMAPPKELVDLDLADTKTDIDVARARLMKKVELQEQAMAQRQISQEQATGSTLGKAFGAALAPFESITVTQGGQTTNVPLTQASAFAATGSLDAVSLGTAPTPTQMSQAALAGKDLIMGPSGEMIAVPIGIAPGGVPAGAVLTGPDAFKVVDEVKQFVAKLRNPEMLKMFPSEAQYGTTGARAAGFAQQYIRAFTDTPQLLTLRGEARQLGFRLARLLGSNSQLSDAERESAQAIIAPLINGTATQEQVVEAANATERFATALDTRKTTGGLQAIQQRYGAKNSRELEQQFIARIEAGQMNEQEAIDTLNRAARDGLPE